MYFYFLGHQPEIALNELAVLTQNRNLVFDQKWGLADKLISVNQSGSLVFSLEIIKEFNQTNQAFESEIYKSIQEINLPKKLGFVDLTHFFKKNSWLSILKQSGAKKINFLDQIPTIGNFKFNSNWYFFLSFNGNFYLTKLVEYFNQQFWANLDLNLPNKNLKIGIINLKLARTLNNLNSKFIIWDPFCGFGRNLISGIDLKTQFFGSDKIPSLVEFSKQNLEYALPKFRNSKIQKFEFFNYDVLDGLKKKLPPPLGIATEGYLGYSFNQQPTKNEAMLELREVFSLWEKFLPTAKKNGVSEIVLCLPGYSSLSDKTSIDLFKPIANNSGYSLVNFLNGQNFLGYAREKTIVKHLIVKLIFLDQK